MVEDIIGVYETTLSEWNRGTDRRR
jgi:hypothetical protein